MYSLRIQIMFSVLSIFLPNSLFLSAFVSFIHVGVFPEMSGDFWLSNPIYEWGTKRLSSYCLKHIALMSPFLLFSCLLLFSFLPCFTPLLWLKRISPAIYTAIYCLLLYSQCFLYPPPVLEGMEESWRSRYLAAEYIPIVSLGKSGKRWRKLNWVNQMKTWQKWKPTEDWEPDQLPRHLFLILYS